MTGDILDTDRIDTTLLFPYLAAIFWPLLLHVAVMVFLRQTATTTIALFTTDQSPTGFLSIVDTFRGNTARCVNSTQSIYKNTPTTGGER